MTKRQDALANVSALASIGVQAIEAQKARKAWLDAKSDHRKLLREWSSDTDRGYLDGETFEPDEEIESAYAQRRATAREGLKQARKLRSMVSRYQVALKEMLA